MTKASFTATDMASPCKHVWPPVKGFGVDCSRFRLQPLIAPPSLLPSPHSMPIVPSPAQLLWSFRFCCRKRKKSVLCSPARKSAPRKTRGRAAIQAPAEAESDPRLHPQATPMALEYSYRQAWKPTARRRPPNPCERPKPMSGSPLKFH